MKALVCSEYGAPESLHWIDHAMPAPGPSQVRIRVHAAGVNFVDALFIAGTYQVKIPPPFIPGNELAGTIDALGDGVGTPAGGPAGDPVGDPVGGPVGGPAGDPVGGAVAAWRVGDQVMAQAGTGAFAEYAVVHVGQLRAMPARFSFAQAAAFQLTYATALYALRERAALRDGETLLVLGAAGGVGTAAIDIGRQMGATVIACAGTDEKLAACTALGAHATINYDREDLKERAKALTNGRGADVIYDPVGDRYSEPALRAIAWEGRFLVIGFAAGNIARIPLNLPLLKGCQIVGVDWGQLARTRPEQTLPVWRTLGEWAAAGALRPRIHAQYALRDGARALRDVLDRVVIGKAVLVVD